jgi:hypothetical protein
MNREKVSGNFPGYLFKHIGINKLFKPKSASTNQLCSHDGYALIEALGA